MKNIFSVKWVYFFSYIVMITPSNETLSCFHRLDFRISFWFAFPLRMGNTDEYISYSRFLNLIYLLFNHHCFLRKRLICMLKLKLFWQLDQECELVLPGAEQDFCLMMNHPKQWRYHGDLRWRFGMVPRGPPLRVTSLYLSYYKTTADINKAERSFCFEAPSVFI